MDNNEYGKDFLWKSASKPDEVLLTLRRTKVIERSMTANPEGVNG